MNYTPELQSKIDELALKKENILYLKMKNEYWHEIRVGEKDVEYRDVTDFYLSKLFSKDKAKNYAEMKPITHILFQGGYNADSPRMLIECKGWVIENKNYPNDADFSNFARYEDCINLILGKIEYDSVGFSVLVPTKKRKKRKW
jgi:hypothetical protein